MIHLLITFDVKPTMKAHIMDLWNMKHWIWQAQTDVFGMHTQSAFRSEANQDGRAVVYTVIYLHI